jgi:hypothetical protein
MTLILRYINIYIDRGLGEDISFEQFLLNWQLDEESYILGIWYIIQKPTLFLKQKPNDIRTNVFGIYVKVLWEANTSAQYILDPYVVA